MPRRDRQATAPLPIDYRPTLRKNLQPCGKNASIEQVARDRPNT